MQRAKERRTKKWKKEISEKEGKQRQKAEEK